jgi:hypothetical protein
MQRSLSTLETMYKINSLPLEEERRRLELSYQPKEQSTKTPYSFNKIIMNYK